MHSVAVPVQTWYCTCTCIPHPYPKSEHTAHYMYMHLIMSDYCTDKWSNGNTRFIPGDICQNTNMPHALYYRYCIKLLPAVKTLKNDHVLKIKLARCVLYLFAQTDIYRPSCTCK